jgi:hypothetical protein
VIYATASFTLGSKGGGGNRKKIHANKKGLKKITCKQSASHIIQNSSLLPMPSLLRRSRFRSFNLILILMTQQWLIDRLIFFYLILHWIYQWQWRNHDLILNVYNVYNLFKYLYANITSNSFGNGVINKWFPAPIVRFTKTSFFSCTIEWKAFFWCAVLKLSNSKILWTCWYK